MQHKMSTSQALDIAADRCAKCFTMARHGYPLKLCSDCSKQFHVKCLYKMSAGKSEFVMLCSSCRQKKLGIREKEKENTAGTSGAVSKTALRKSITKTKHTSPAINDARKVTDLQASSRKSTSACRVDMKQGTPASVNVKSSTLKIRSLSQTRSNLLSVSNAGNSVLDHVSTRNNSKINVNSNDSHNSSFVLLDSLKTILDACLNDFLVKLASSPAGAAGLSSDFGTRMASLESTIKHQEILLGNMTLELHELRKTNDELFRKLVRSSSHETCSRVEINKTNSNIVDEPGEKINYSFIISPRSSITHNFLLKGHSSHIKPALHYYYIIKLLIFVLYSSSHVM